MHKSDHIGLLCRNQCIR